jgi:hypothetical protein
VPKVEDTQRLLFKNCGKDSLISIVKNSITNAITVSHRTNPQFHLAYLNVIFEDQSMQTSYFERIYNPQPKPKSTVGARPLSYCPKCIQEKIFSIGHALFMANWLFSNYCEKHEIHLHFLPIMTRGNAIESIKKIFKGDFSDENETYQGKRIVNDMSYQRHMYSRAFKMPISRCLQNLLVRKIKVFTRDYIWKVQEDPNLVKVKKMGTYYNSIRYNSGKFKQIDYECIDWFFEDMIDQRYKPVVDFFDDECEVLFISEKIKHKDVVSDKMLVPIIRNCNHCVYKTSECPFSKVIFNDLDDEYENQYIENICDRRF